MWALCTCSFRSYLRSAKIQQSHVYKEVFQQLFSKGSEAWLTQNLTFGGQLLIAWGREASYLFQRLQYEALGLKSHSTTTDPYQLLLSYSNTLKKKIHRAHPLSNYDSATKLWEVVARWQTQKVKSIELQRHHQKGLWEQILIRRLYRIRFHPDLTTREELQGQQSSQLSTHFQGKHSIYAGAPNVKWSNYRQLRILRKILPWLSNKPRKEKQPEGIILIFFFLTSGIGAAFQVQLPQSYCRWAQLASSIFLSSPALNSVT